MGEEKTLDPVDSLARNLFARDHPHRIWRPSWREWLDHPEDVSATNEERKLYRCFAECQLRGVEDRTQSPHCSGWKTKRGTLVRSD